MSGAEDIYRTLLGQLRPDFRIPGVDNLFVPGEAYYRNYVQAMDAYKRLLTRLDMDEDDDDIEIIINALLENERIVALKMFEYGQKSKPHP